MTLAQSPGNCLLSVAEVDESISSAIYGIRASWTKDQQFTRFIYRPDVRFGSWPCKNAVAAAFLEKPGLFVAVLIAAISGWIPIIFITRVRLVARTCSFLFWHRADIPVCIAHVRFRG